MAAKRAYMNPAAAAAAFAQKHGAVLFICSGPRET